MLAVVREQARVQLGIAGGAHRAGALGRKGLQMANTRRGQPALHGSAQRVDAAEHMHHALAVRERVGQRLAELGFVTSGASRPMCWPRNCVSNWTAMLSGVCGCTAAPSLVQCWVPSLTYSRRRKCHTSVVVPTVDLRPPRDRRCSIATVGGMPYTASTSGRPAGCTMERA